jgi:hypothetical protein
LQLKRNGVLDWGESGCKAVYTDFEMGKMIVKEELEKLRELIDTAI